MINKKQIKIESGELENVEYCIKGILEEIKSDSVDLGYIREKLTSIEHTAENVSGRQRAARQAIFDDKTEQ
jgi:hypothetical protein